ncbi:hypothetical protein SOVF_133770, partial [Spinacia oleracea]
TVFDSLEFLDLKIYLVNMFSLQRLLDGPTLISHIYMPEMFENSTESWCTHCLSLIYKLKTGGVLLIQDPLMSIDVVLFWSTCYVVCRADAALQQLVWVSVLRGAFSDMGLWE